MFKSGNANKEKNRQNLKKINFFLELSCDFCPAIVFSSGCPVNTTKTNSTQNSVLKKLAVKRDPSIDILRLSGDILQSLLITQYHPTPIQMHSISTTKYKSPEERLLSLSFE